MSSEWWAFIFLMLVMKLPIVYLCLVIWWAVKEPRPEEGAAKQLAELGPEPPLRWRPWRLRRRPRSGPHGSPVRRPVPAARAALPYAKHE